LGILGHVKIDVCDKTAVFSLVLALSQVVQLLSLAKEPEEVIGSRSV